MQTIENSLLQVSVDEQGAQISRLLAKTKHFDYLQEQEREEKMPVAFYGASGQNLALHLPWTVVDKGDARVSMTMMDTASSYRKFPYHFELMLTYVLEGNQVNVDFYVKNNSNKEMPFQTGLVLPLRQKWHQQQKDNKVVSAGAKDQLSVTSLDFKPVLKDQQLICLSEELKLAAESARHLKLSFVLS